VDNSSAVTIANSRFVWNNWTGLGLSKVKSIAITGTNLDDNGSMGLGALRVTGLTMTGTTNNRNAWRGEWGGWNGWENGMKLVSVHGATITGHTAIGNHSHGLWLDSDNRDITVTGATICGNKLAGMFLEASQGPIRIDRTTICDNRDRGILAGNASNVTISGSRIVNNDNSQLNLSGVQTGRKVTDWETGRSIDVGNANWTVTGTLFQGSTTRQLLVDNTWSAATWTSLKPTFTWSGNDFRNPAAPASFRLLGSGQLGTLSDWQRSTGLDGRGGG